MVELIEANWLVALAVLLVAIVVAWLIWGRTSKVRERADTPDVLSEGAAPAERNSALIDAPSAVATIVPLPASVGMGGIGEIIAHAADDEVTSAAEHDEAVRAAEGPADDLTRIKGIGPKLRTRLAELGVTRFAQIAAWDEAELARVDGNLGAFAGRPLRDNWIEQARLLAAGDSAAYEAKFGKL